MKVVAGVLFLGVFCTPLASAANSDPGYQPQSTCSDIKAIYQASSCCGSPATTTEFSAVPMGSATKPTAITGDNPCHGAKLYDWAGSPGLGPIAGYFNNTECADSGVLEQSGTNVTRGYTGQFQNDALHLGVIRGPITSHYWEAGLCPVNVHWHLGTEHLSVGQYDQAGTSPHFTLNDTYHDPAGDGSDSTQGGRLRRRLAGTRVRKGFSCHHYSDSDTRFTTEYAWKHCRQVHVGETYEIHWPHSAAGRCGTPWQYQTPFYDGVFCNASHAGINLNPLNTFEKIGVQAQIFTIVNDENYYYPDLIRGMIVHGEYGQDVSYYTGSTTGTSRDNTICSKYTPITWQVDRKCHLISASSFDKMCADMLSQSDDMSRDVSPAGARVLVADQYAANDNQR